ncbi:hypothetical protein [Planktothrix paucivesiculata]|uniref:Uncharacterized protein n=1 Tax=Planktothrix paucivesiculata PCC 9631 TaxID=671071 RepID=A0A7Z9E1G5_9CYAN|nr:hypothetical protein [Planktothrix paucivesiculata]VXD21320.1 hypothetical protein PL9631_560040 [Planktothrix paucivesiculata PCC 9631]
MSISDPPSLSGLSFKQIIEKILKTKSISRQERYAMRYWLLRQLDEQEKHLVSTLQRALSTGQIKIVD